MPVMSNADDPVSGAAEGVAGALYSSGSSSSGGPSSGRFEPESHLLCPAGLRRALDAVVVPNVSGVTLALAVTEDGDNLYHSSGTTKAEADLHAGIAFSMWQANRTAMERAVADSKSELADVGDFKMLLVESEKGLMCMHPCHSLFVVLFAKNMEKAELGMIKNRTKALAEALEAPFRKIFN